MSFNKPASFVQTPTARIAYREFGSGPALVALHGGGPGVTGMGNFYRNVDDLSDGYRVIVPDQPGFGESRFTNDGGATYHLESAKVMVELLDALGVEKAHLLGNSMGGGVALQMALHYPDRVGKLVLMGPYFRGFGHRFISPEHEGDNALTGYFPDPSYEKMRAVVRLFASNPDAIEGLDEVARQRYENTLNPEIMAGFARMSQKIADPDTRSPWDKIASIPHPTQMIWGRDDKFCHLEYAFQFLEAMKNAELVVLRDTGHWAQVEHPQTFASHVKAFLARP